jgi:Arc/MetJ-type ribon-helix-helix transcriptional regulator
MNVLRFSLPRRFSSSRNSLESIVMLMLCFNFCSLRILCIFNIQKSFISFTKQNILRGINMKTLRVSDDAHQKLTAMLGEITAQTMKMQTYTDAIESLLSQSVILPPELLNEIQGFIEENKQLGYTTREEFIRDAIRYRLRFLRDQYEYIEIPMEEYEKLQQAIRDMDMGFLSVDDFIDQQVRSLLEKHQAWTKQKEDYEKR